MKTKTEQLHQTKKEINSYLDYGAQKVSLNEYKSMLNDFGLNLDIDPKNYMLKYYNTSNKQHYLCASTTAIDETGHSYANINGCFYQNHLKKDTPTAKEFREFRQNYFCTLKSGHIVSI